MTTYHELPIQTRSDVDECVIAYSCGGEALAVKTFRAIAEAREFNKFTAIMFGDQVRNRLAKLGYLPITN